MACMCRKHSVEVVCPCAHEHLPLTQWGFPSEETIIPLDLGLTDPRQRGTGHDEERPHHHGFSSNLWGHSSPSLDSTQDASDSTLQFPNPALSKHLDSGPPGPLDGGAQAWITAFGAFLVLFCSFGWINTIGVWQNYYQTQGLSTYSPSAIAWIPSLETFVMFFFGLFAGDIFDRHGPRWLLVTGTILHVLGLMMTSLAKEYYQFVLAQGICSPLGVSLLFYAAMGTVPTWFVKRRAFAFGVVTSGSSLGGVVLPIATQRLMDRYGFAWSLRIVALLMLYLLTIAIFITTSRTQVPSRKGFNITAYGRPLKEVPFALVTIGSCLFTMGFFIPLNFVILEATHYGMSPGLAQYLVSILNAASFFGRIVPGYAADYCGRLNVMVLTCCCTTLLIFALWIPATTNASIVAFASLYGLFSGAYVSMCNAVIAEITPDMSTMGVRTGVFYAFFAIGALVSSPIGGALIASQDGSFVAMQVFAGICCALGSAGILAARVVVGGWSVLVKV